MSSLRQIAANRRNALKSTGPATQEGKQHSRCNALRHGLTAETVIGVLENANLRTMRKVLWTNGTSGTRRSGLICEFIGSTFGFMFRGEQRSEPALKQALLEQRKSHIWKIPAATRKNVREELGPAFRGTLPSRAKSIKIRARLEAQPDQLDRNKGL